MLCLWIFIWVVFWLLIIICFWFGFFNLAIVLSKVDFLELEGFNKVINLLLGIFRLIFFKVVKLLNCLEMLLIIIFMMFLVKYKRS